MPPVPTAGHARSRATTDRSASARTGRHTDAGWSHGTELLKSLSSLSGRGSRIVIHCRSAAWPPETPRLRDASASPRDLAEATPIFASRDMVPRGRQPAARFLEHYRRRCRSIPTIASAPAPTSTGPPIAAPATSFAHRLGRRPWYWPKEADPTTQSTNPRAASIRDVEFASMPRRCALASRQPLRASMPAPLARSHVREQSLTDRGKIGHSEPIQACTRRSRSGRCERSFRRGAR
jgi:hypothetical protein